MQPKFAVIILLAACAAVLWACSPEEAKQPDPPAPVPAPAEEETAPPPVARAQPVQALPQPAPAQPLPAPNPPGIPVARGLGVRPAPLPPGAAGILADPNGAELISSWRDAKVGDWVRFLTHNRKIALFEVTERVGMKLKVVARHFELDGTEIVHPPDIRPIDIKDDDKIRRQSLIQNPFIKRSAGEWKMFGSGRALKGEMHRVDNPSGDNNVSLSCRAVRCGGYTYDRRGRNPYVILVDFGDAENPPKWKHLKPAELLRFWYERRPWPEPPIPQGDPPEGEPAEPPEE